MAQSTSGSPTVLTHRGLQPSAKNFPWHESALEAFECHLAAGFGIEFDVHPTLDGGLIVSHENSLSGITNGNESRSFIDLTASEICSHHGPRGRLGTLAEVLERIDRSSAPLCALHLKGKFQTRDILDALVRTLCAHEALSARIIIFDCRIETARALKRRLPSYSMAPSVVHAFDQTRFNDIVGKTLYTSDEILRHRDIFDWVWMDEWDRTNEGSRTKQLYTEATVHELRHQGFKIAFVSPELHATSPGLLGAEAHPDGGNVQRVHQRWTEILELRPDAICTDYPVELQRCISALSR